MPVKLADTRKTATLEDAKKLLTALRQATCRRETIVARAEKRIADISAKAQEDAAPIDAEIAQLSGALRDFILANKPLFRKPKHVVTPDGKFGLQRASRVEVLDPDTALDYIFDRGYDECIKVKRSFNKPKIAARFDRGEPIPGCDYQQGEIAHYTITKALIEEARENA